MIISGWQYLSFQMISIGAFFLWGWPFGNLANACLGLWMMDFLAARLEG